MLFENILQEGERCAVELKSGIWFRGRLVGLDNYMNVTLDELAFPAHENYDHLKQLKEVFLRGDKIKFITYDD